jgi:serine/threonine protein kinase
MAEDGPRIIDFGIARAVDAPSLTASGVLIGTFSFMSPEQIRGERLGPESDIFSFGSVLAYAATGHGPFDSASIPAILHGIAMQPPELGSLSGPLRGVISACLAKNPADRPTLGNLLSVLSYAPRQLVPGWQPQFPPHRESRCRVARSHPRTRRERSAGTELTGPRPRRHGLRAILSLAPGAPR